MDDQEAMVCYGCVDDDHLQQLIRSEGRSTGCFYCGKKRKAISIGRLSDLVAEVMYAFFESAPYGERGDELTFHVAEILGCGDSCAPLVGDVCGELVSCSQWQIMQGDEPRFDEFGLYSRLQFWPVETERKWRDFKSGIMHKSRFFNQSGKEFLEWLFGSIDSFRRGSTSDLNEDGVVRTIKADGNVELFRARECSLAEAQEIARNPDDQLGAPPKEKARAGRMNPEGVPVFMVPLKEKPALQSFVLR